MYSNQSWHIRVLLDEAPSLLTRQSSRGKDPKAGNSQRQSLFHTVRSPIRKPRCTTTTYAEGLVQTHANSLVDSSVSVIPYEPKLVGSVGFLVVSLAPLASTILPPLFHRIP